MIAFQLRVFVQIEQLHLFVPWLRSMSASKRTAPQWQLPLKVLIIIISQETVANTAVGRQGQIAKRRIEKRVSARGGGHGCPRYRASRNLRISFSSQALHMPPTSSVSPSANWNARPPSESTMVLVQPASRSRSVTSAVSCCISPPQIRHVSIG